MKNKGINTDHSVVIIGWGESPIHNSNQTDKYWIVRNSFGVDWGLHGDFYVGRGNNDFGIEEEVSAFEMRRCDLNNKDECTVIEPWFK